MEIGSEFWLESVPIVQKEESEWLKKFHNFVLTSSGRGAISLLLKEVKPTTKTALLPAYICDSVLIPFERQGYYCYFYDIDKGLAPIIDTIKGRKDIGIFLHLGYFGFPTNQNLIHIVKELRRKATIIIEDITHTLFLEDIRFEENDYYVASIRKWMGIPSGGLLASLDKKIESNLYQNELFASVRREALLLKSNYIYHKDHTQKEQYQNLFSKGEALLDEDIEPSNIDKLSRNILNQLNVNTITRKRQVNFRTLSEGLRDIEFIKPVFTILPEKVCPMFYPIYISHNRTNIRDQLAKQQIYCPIHWSIPQQILRKNFKSTAEIYKTILSIPCDQRYAIEDMNRVIQALQDL